MKDLLFLVHRIPFPPNKGDKIRSYHFLKHLAGHYRVHLGAFIDDSNDWQYTGELGALCAETCFLGINPFRAKIKSLQGLVTGQALSLPYYKSQAMQDWVDNVIEKYRIDTVLVFSSAMAQFIHDRHKVDLIVDYVDVDSDKWRQYADKKSGLRAWIYRRESDYLLRYEKKLAEKSKSGIFVSEQEADLFKTLAPAVSEKITYINNGVDTEYFSPDQLFASPYPGREPVIVFTGAMDYWANVNAVEWFARYALPHIVKKRPATKFYIVGGRPAKEVRALASRHVIVTGAVADIRPYIAHAGLAVAPLRIARGIQNKVLEAMAMGKYVIASAAAMEGIPYDRTLDVLVSDEAEKIAECTDAVLQGETATFGSRTNREFIKARFSWEQNLKQLTTLLQP
ncbi:TIGR03087 family PEP-CTERM/XrtA system glycosyltransferase [Methylobacter marinus]|uniref:TIGR03087 family PEP-CTERM/XrtA system glycosyltransferase n=1 Tax=Methylobacter marinus TaxID=34058 RepID=UPI00036B1FA9|nr:TIGR03087 family PEP-CTERM/XrtA system glycosyltransferase [Methylobacter marinus]